MSDKPSPEKGGIGFWVVGILVLAAIVAMLVWPASPRNPVTVIPEKAKSGAVDDPAAASPAPVAETPEDAPAELTVADPLETATTTAELEAYVQQRIEELRREVRSPEDFKNFVGKIRPLLDAAGRKAVALGVASDSKKDMATGLSMRITAALANPDAKQSAEEAEALIAEAKLDPELAFPLKQLAFDRRSQPDRTPLGQFDAMVAEGKALAAAMPNVPMAISVIQSMLRRAQFQQRAQGKSPEWYSELFDSLQTFVQSPAFLEPPTGSQDEKGYDRAEVGKRLALMGRLLPGRDFALKAKTIDDKEFDFAVLKGKTVLVNFTASWCGPCRAETPHTMKSYKEYNERGFEVVSVGVWDSTANLKRLAEEEKIPWVMLSEELTDKTDGMSLAESYGINGVPTCILVGPDGKVLMSEARYPRLQARLEQLFPAPDESEISPETPPPPAPVKEADTKTEAEATGK